MAEKKETKPVTAAPRRDLSSLPEEERKKLEARMKRFGLM